MPTISTHRIVGWLRSRFVQALAAASLPVSAEVTFQSQQAPGYGPSDAPDETCTQWDITYQLTTSPSGEYQIYQVTSDVDNAC